MKKRELQGQKETGDKWYTAINNFAPVDGADYSWICEYAKYRFEWVFEKTRYVEEKSNGLLKLVLTISAGVWLVFTFLLTRGQRTVLSSEAFALLAIGCLVVSGVFCLRATWPTEHVYPRGEDKAIECIELCRSGNSAMGRFALMLGDSSEQELFVTRRKAGLVRAGVACAFAAIIAFSLSLLAQFLFR